MRQERVKINYDNVSLEGVLSFPEGKGPFSLVVVCHPHPLYGGNMDNNVVTAVCMGLGKLNLASLKFNFRGVGRSNGRFDGGVGECDDAMAAVSFALAREEINNNKIGICGYSFGSMIAFASAVRDPRVMAVAGISPFIEPPDLLNNYERPKLFLIGDNDAFINAKSLMEMVNVLPGKKELRVYPGIDHFWWRAEDAISGEVSQFFNNNL